ncbi:methionine--tRNA ligase [Streptomyces flavofungini]|uniref:methionine--tRNA ligase n=1 Tax=Streptomyces flavofungini TaxID=68200 RepID=UPI0025AF234F|nr:methionine--tRNA ligase [Streptomyces flavofungini]WJV50702.1 methionine--tRNA ligase [Streptomyces flavofungini]
MTTPRTTYVTTTIPYVNARPHLGFALELVQADVLARHRRHRGDRVRFLTGTDDNSLKNVLAAEAEGVPVQDFVDRNADAFAALRAPLALSYDDFIRTSRDPRHRVGVERLWRLCADSGDLYRRHYEGLYCVGCEQFYAPAELVDGRCAEHGTEPRPVAEENWFFRLSRYADQLHDLISSGRLRIEPAVRRNEVLALIESGLHDFSVSRSQTRARGWGIPVPGDPDQVVYVWWDALGNYVTSLGHGTDDPAFDQWWTGATHRSHLLGKGVVRFHAVYWPALLLSAGLPLPTDILVHDYLTVDGRKISKSGGTSVDPAELTAEFGTDAVRWWLLREVPRVGDADFTRERLVARANADLAGGVGNLVNRVVTMVHRFRDGRVPERSAGAESATAEGAAVGGAAAGDVAAEGAEGVEGTEQLVAVCREVPGLVDDALADFDFRRATAAVWRIVQEADRCVDGTRPWELAKAERGGDRAAGERLDGVLAALVGACRALADQLGPFLPESAARVAAQCASTDGRLPAARPLFARLGEV